MTILLYQQPCPRYMYMYEHTKVILYETLQQETLKYIVCPIHNTWCRKYSKFCIYEIQPFLTLMDNIIFTNLTLLCHLTGIILNKS